MSSSQFEESSSSPSGQSIFPSQTFCFRIIQEFYGKLIEIFKETYQRGGNTFSTFVTGKMDVVAVVYMTYSEFIFVIFLAAVARAFIIVIIKILHIVTFFKGLVLFIHSALSIAITDTEWDRDAPTGAAGKPLQILTVVLLAVSPTRYQPG